MAVVERVTSHAGQIFTFEDFCAMAKLSVLPQADDPDRPSPRGVEMAAMVSNSFSNHVISLSCRFISILS